MLWKRGEFKDNYNTGLFFITTILLSLVFCQCKNSVSSVDRAFYHWKSAVRLTDYEVKVLDSLQVNTLYLKLFDVDWDDATKQPVPVAKLVTTNKGELANYKIIPTVFITNECLQRIDSSQVYPLAIKIYELIKSICSLNQIDSLFEIQMDCDWTSSTRQKYFSLLQHIKLQTPGILLSATIRLHQVKFISKTGIPPIDKGLLMCYNMGNLKNPAATNSIIEPAELKKYIANLPGYPLQLDIALPLFEWKVLFRNNMYRGLIQQLPGTVFNSSFCRQVSNRIEILKDTLLGGYDLKKGDLLRIEQSELDDLVSVANSINSRLKNSSLRVALYHLDSVTLSKYNTHELESIYRSFH
jgi:hypothetical protein